jgi:uracil-DNA glycosylase family 4
MTVEIDKVGSLEELAEIASVCTACRLCETRKNVVFASGTSDAKVMVVGEGPGQQEDEQGLPFVGRSGQLLISLLAEVGIAREDVYIANVVKCRPPKNRDPRQDEIDTCKPFLRRQIELVDPSVVITLGNFSSKLLMPTTTGITRLRGKAYEWWGRYLVPTFHPAAALRGGESVKNDIRADLGIVRSLLEGRVTSDSQEAPNPTISVEPIQVASEEQLGLFGTASS